MSAIVDQSQIASLRVAGRQPPLAASRPATMWDRGSVVALRRRQVIALGGLVERDVVVADRLVTAQDVAGENWWVPAHAVWSDGETGRQETPRPIGLAVAASRPAAMIKGLSERLGWEAVLEFDQRGDLPVATAVGTAGRDAIVLDGRLGHDVPTVIVLGADTIRWGAASTWPGAVRRALFGEDSHADPVGELDTLAHLLRGAGLAVASVDLGTPRLNAAGIDRCSVQLLAGDAAVRSWDAD